MMINYKTMKVRAESLAWANLEKPVSHNFYFIDNKPDNQSFWKFVVLHLRLN